MDTTPTNYAKFSEKIKPKEYFVFFPEMMRKLTRKQAWFLCMIIGYASRKESVLMEDRQGRQFVRCSIRNLCKYGECTKNEENTALSELVELGYVIKKRYGKPIRRWLCVDLEKVKRELVTIND